MIGARGSESKAVISSRVVIAADIFVKGKQIRLNLWFSLTYPPSKNFLQFFCKFEVLRGAPLPVPIRKASKMSKN